MEKRRGIELPAAQPILTLLLFTRLIMNRSASPASLSGKCRFALLTGLCLLIPVLSLDVAQAQETEQRQGWLRSRLKERLQARAQNEGTATRFGKNIPTHADVAYGPDPLQRMDIYLPEKKQGAGNAPVLLMVHGGGWKRGDKRLGAALQNKVPYYNGKGIAVVSLNYRLVPQVTPVDQAQDVAKALAFIQDNAGKWGADKSRVVLMGHSAGAHLVTLVTADARLNFARNALPWLGTISLDGAGVDVEKTMTEGTSMRLLKDIYNNAFGNDPALWKAASPMAQLRPGAAPMLMICSTTRPDKPCKQTEDFVAKAKQMGVRASTLPVAMSHGEINSDVGLENELTRAIDQFMASLGLKF